MVLVNLNRERPLRQTVPVPIGPTLIAPLLAASAALLSACEHQAPDPRAQPPVVAVTTVGGADDGDQRFTGVVRARVESDLGFRVAGKIAARLVDAGQAVRRGQPLMRLDPNDLSLSAQAQVAAVVAARARSVQADADLKRLEGLIAQGAVSAETYDQAKAGADSARAQLAAAEAQARAADNARSYSVLTADADGVVQETLAEPGQVVAAGQTVARLAHAGPREAAANLPETLRPALGSAASASLYGGPGAAFPARLRQLSQSADPATRTYEARYVLAGAGASAPLGATVTLTLPGHGGGAEVPLGAIYDPGPGPGVWLVTPQGRVSFRAVRLLALAGETARVEGLDPGARIVGLGADRLREGEAVRPAPMPGTLPAGTLPAGAAPAGDAVR
jgi:RND family efflux transporter MFP subunit